jgi:hypothetical protein
VKRPVKERRKLVKKKMEERSQPNSMKEENVGIVGI